MSQINNASKSDKIKSDKMSLNEFGIFKMFNLVTISSQEEEELYNEELPDELPILVLRNMVLFPGIITPLFIIRKKSSKLVKDVKAKNLVFGVVAQKNPDFNEPTTDEIYKVGVVAKITDMLEAPNGSLNIVIETKKRFKITKFVKEEPYMVAKVDYLEEDKTIENEKEFDFIIENIKETATRLFGDEKTPINVTIKNIESKTSLINLIASYSTIEVNEKQKILEENSLYKRTLTVFEKLEFETEKQKVLSNIKFKTQEALASQQRNYFLNQQLKTIQQELGDSEEYNELKQFEKKAKNKKWSKDVAAVFYKELERLKRANFTTAEYGVQLNYIETLLDLPWGKYSKDKFDLQRAQKILDKNHFGLDDVKKRIIEHLAVLKLRGDMKSPIICLYGPPGVGKTSLGKSIAKALGRKYIRMSLGGLRDEAEIRGHRKTYIGAMPGRIIQNIRKAKTSNPVFVLDEIDKLGKTHDGDPSSAMLEVLDPEQNSEFYDNFLEVGYDLSKILFIATANNINDIPWALRDRMEMINVSGYTTEEKVEIVKKHLLKKQLEEHGLSNKDLNIGKKEIEKIIENYTRESGVRGLEKQIAKVVRYVAKSIAMENEYNTTISSEDIEEILGTPKLERDKYENNNTAGVVTGLAWTKVGGDILFIESIASKGKGNLSITGNIGNVMKESATIAMKYIKSNADDFNINSDVLDKYDVHIHVPEGATPKDGPSAGVTILTSLISLFTQQKVKNKLAMTGEITLRGKVLPVGGIKEKILAAKRANIKEIILCAGNKKDVDEINPNYLKGLQFHYVTDMKELINIALTKQKVKHAKLFKV